MENIPYYLIQSSKAINYYRYKSVVLDKIFSISTWNKKEKRKYKNQLTFLENLKKSILLSNPKLFWDNKIVIEYETISGAKFYLGYYDDNWSIGLSFRSEWLDAPIKLKDIK
jgi:hypothetical protein